MTIPRPYRKNGGLLQIAGGKLLEEENIPVNAEFVETVTKASPLHDIGKVGIPDAILLSQAN